MRTEPRLPRAVESERYCFECFVTWPERSEEFLPQLRSTDFFDTIHQQLWRAFNRQHKLGSVDPLEVAKQLNCAAYLLELAHNATTSAHFQMHAERVREAARARELYDILQKGADAILRGRPYDSVRNQLYLALEAYEEAATAA